MKFSHKKILAFFIASIIMISILPGCSCGDEEDIISKSVAAPNKNEPAPDLFDESLIGAPTGNSIGNLQNGGLAAADGDYVYYSAIDEKGLFRESAGGGAPEKLSDIGGGSIQVTGGYVYYISANTDERGKVVDRALCKLSADGTVFSELARGKNISNLIIVGDWAYFSRERGDISRIKTDASDEQTLLGADDGRALSFVVSDGRIFFTFMDKVNGKSGLYRMSAAGSEPAFVAGVSIQSRFAVYGEELFYTSSIETDDGETEIAPITSINRIDGSGFKMLGETPVFIFCIGGDKIYFADEQGAICSMDADGNNKKEIVSAESGAVCNINVIGGELFFMRMNETGSQLCRCNLDGSNVREV